MTAVAHEVSRRMTPSYAKERATEMARYKAIEARDRAVDNPWLVPLLGAGIGALVGRALVSRAQDARERGWELRDPGRRYYSGERRGSAYRGEDHGYEMYGESWRDASVGDEGQSMRERASEAASDVKERVSGAAADVRERVSEKADEYGHRVREGAQHLRERIPDAEGISERAQEQPGLWALGAMALGALFGFAVPVSERERRALEPARAKAREAGEQALDKAISRAESVVGERRTGEEPGPGAGASAPGTSLTQPLDPLHDPLH